MSAFLEKLAKLEHERWLEFTKKMILEESLTEDLIDRWVDDMCLYEDLSESRKYIYREKAKDVLKVMLDHGVFIGDRTIESE